jgi:hypothetical protein
MPKKYTRPKFVCPPHDHTMLNAEESLIEESTFLILYDPSYLEISFIQLLPSENRILEFFLGIFA